MARYCVCGMRVRDDQRLCRECAEIYGTDSSEWPEWLRWYVNDLKRDLRSEINHDNLGWDEIEPNGNGGYRPKREFTLRGCRTETHLYEERGKH